MRQHRLAWSLITAGFLASAMLWGSILGMPFARPAAPFEMAMPSLTVNIEHPIEMAPAR